MLLFWSLIAAQPGDPTSPGAISAEVRQLAAADQAVLTQGTRLAIAAASLCNAPVATIGIDVHDLDEFAADAREAAASVFALTTRPGVTAVAAGGPADQAGVRAGDAVVEIDGLPPSGPPGIARTDAILWDIGRRTTVTPIALTIQRAGQTQDIMVTAIPACPARFQVVSDPQPDARADGMRIEVTTGLVAAAAGSDELAAVLAHELAHNILHHRDRLGDRRSGRDARAAERAADRLSVHVLVLAGYDPAAALTFWRRMPRRGMGREHPGTRERLRALAAAIRDESVPPTPAR